MVRLLRKRKKVESSVELSNGGPDTSFNDGLKAEITDAAIVGDLLVEKSAHTVVTETLRKFNRLYLHFVQEEKKRCAEAESKIGKKSKENALATNGSVKKSSKRPDLKVISEMKRNRTTLYSEKKIGSLPGIDVGHQFFSRAEMFVVGLHNHWLNGIDFIGQNGRNVHKKGDNMDSETYKLPLAISIVLSGQYEDDLDKCDEIVYTGQGGNNLLGDKRQISDQKLLRGNLALKNCLEQDVPVRVTRGHKCDNSYVGKVYTYDGLYKVVDYWAETGVSGYVVYKFKLKRIEGQPTLTTKEVYFTRGRIPKSISEINGLVCKDISKGVEDMPIPVTNLIDDVSPEGYAYIKHLKFSKNIPPPAVAAVGCNCKGICNDPRTCACAKLNGGDFPFVHHNVGRLVEPKAIVFECGPNCGCGPKCINRTCQSGPMFRLEVFRTARKGWGVRSWDYIPAGAPVCEYIGVVRRTSDLNRAADNSYVFDIDCLQTMQGLDGRESRLRDVKLPPYLEKLKSESDSIPFCIDGGETGNVARFINHSCGPNLFVQCVLSHHHDIRLARIMLIAADNIPPLKELSYDYGYEIDSVLGPDGEITQIPCYCGVNECRKRLY